MFIYQLRDLNLAAMTPLRLWALATSQALSGSPLVAQNDFLRGVAASASMIERNTRLYDKPSFSIYKTRFRGTPVDVRETAVDSNPFCHLLYFKRYAANPTVTAHMQNDPKVLIVTPLSGHFSTLMRGTVEAMLPAHNVFVTDWVDAKMIPAALGRFDMDAQIAYLVEIIRKLGPDVHVIGISQASYAAFAALSILATLDDAAQPRSLTLIGGPIDASRGYVTLRDLVLQRSLEWFKEMQIQLVPPYYPGAFRPVYPGFMQLQDRMALTLDRQLTEQVKYFHHLIRGDDDAAEEHEKFYDEFLAVMDVPAELYLQYVEKAYSKCALAKGTYQWNGLTLDPSKIRRTALLTIEGELDDLSPAGQTIAAHDLCTNLPKEMKQAHLEIGVGHYGVFSGKKWRTNIQPVIHKFIRTHSQDIDEVA